MDAIINNPYRILGLESTNDEIIISNHFHEILFLLKNGENAFFPIDDYYNNIFETIKNQNNYNLLISSDILITYRNIESVKIAYEKLQDPIRRKFYSLFTFEFDQKYQNLNIYNLIRNWETELHISEKQINKFSHSSFTNFLNYFSEDQNDNYIIEKEYNRLTIKNLTDNGCFLKPKMVNKISQDLNFGFEFDCEWIDGIDNKDFRIFWGKNNFKNSYYSFGVSGNGFLLISDCENNIIKDNDSNFIGWKKSDIVLQHSKNHLEVRKNNDCIEFYVNLNLVHKTSSYKSFYGDEMGLIVSGKQTVIFSNYKINYYESYTAYASEYEVSNKDLKKIKNIALYYFTQTFFNNNSHRTNNADSNIFSDQEDSFLILPINLEKALILFAKVFQKDMLLANGIFNNVSEYKSEFGLLSKYFFTNLLISINNIFLKNDNYLNYENLKEIFDTYSNDYIDLLYEKEINNIYIKLKDETSNFPLDTDVIVNQFDVDLFKQSKLNKFQFEATINNPFRVLALNYNASNKEISKRVSDLLVYSEMGKKAEYSNDLFFGEVDRTSENINEAAKRIDNINQKIYYALLWFIEENEADKDFLETIRELNEIEKSQDFKNHFISKSADLIKNKINFIHARNDISEMFYNNALSKLEIFIDTNYQKEKIKFCLFEDVISYFPINNNTQKINNQLIIDSNTETGVSLFKEIYFDKEVDFEIEFDCEWIDGEDDNKLYNIVFGKDTEGYYRFGISANGSVYFDAIFGRVVQNIYGWHKDKNINIKGKNTLKIEYSFEKNVFYITINNKLHDSSHAYIGIKALKKPLLGNNIGISVFGKQKIAFSNFQISYTHHIFKEVSKSKIRSSNFTTVINLIAFKLSICSFFKNESYNSIPHIIALFGKILNSNSVPEFAEKSVVDYRNIDILIIERYFIDDIYYFTKSHLDKDEELSINKFIDAFYTFSNEAQNYLVHKFIGKPIVGIEENISKSKILLKQNPLEGKILGLNLIESTKENLAIIKKILSYTNLQYRLLANNLAEAILDCDIIWFNSIREKSEASIDEGREMLRLNNYAKIIAVDGNARKRVSESLEFIKKWISDKTKKEQEKINFTAPISQQFSQTKTTQSNYINPQQSNHTKSQETYKNSKLQNEVIGFIVSIIIVIVLIIYFSSQDNKKIANSKEQVPIDNSTSKVESNWKNNMLENGTSPYDNFFGKGLYDYNSNCWVLFKNGNSTDAIVCLENTSSGKTIRNEYIQAGTDYKMTNLPSGIYQVKVFYGKDWNPSKTLKNGLIKGAYDTDLSFSISDNSKDWIVVETIETEKGISFTTGEITLYSVSNGNMQQRNINIDNFFK